MSRCALLPSRSDPITLRLVIELFNRVWQDEVDKLYLNINSLIEPEVMEFIGKYASRNSKVVFSATDHSLDHGNSLTKMFHESTEDNIVLVEDDSFVYGKGMIDKYFRMVESNAVDACGSLRWSCTSGLIDRGRLYFELWDEKYRNGGWYWPCFFFVKRSDLAKTDLDFRGKGWNAGEHIAPLQWTTPTPETSDTMVWMSMQLRALKLRFLDFPNPNDIGNPSYQWVHTGSLSSFIESELTDDDNVPLSLRKRAAKYPVIHTALKGDKGIVETKFAWMMLALDLFWDEFDQIREFRDLYKKAMFKYGEQFGFDWDRIRGLTNAYRGIMNL